MLFCVLTEKCRLQLKNKKNPFVLPAGVTEPVHLPSTKTIFFLSEEMLSPCMEWWGSERLVPMLEKGFHNTL